MYSSTSASEPICSCMNCTRSRSSRQVLDDGGLRDAERGVLGGGLHEQRRTQPPRQREPRAAPEYRELRRRDAMEGEQLLAQHLVARQQQAARIAAGIGRAHQLEERDHVLVVGDDAVEFLEQVEHHLGLPFHQCGTQLGQRVEHAQGLHFVAAGAQRRDHVVLGAPLVDFLLAVALEAGRGHEARVHDHERPQSPHARSRRPWLRR